MTTTYKSLVIFVGDTDMWQEALLYAAIITTLERNGIAGATVNAGLMGYGRHRRIHRKGPFGVQAVSSRRIRTPVDMASGLK